MPRKRSSGKEKVKRRMHIYCEGEKTEPNYLNSYIQDRFGDRLRDVIIVENAKTNTPIQLVKEAIKSKTSGIHPSGDAYWAVYDRESPAKYGNNRHEEAYILAEKHDVKICLTNVCFEYWLILHFVASDAPYQSYDDLMSNSCLKEKIQKITNKKYDKGADNIYRLLSSYVTEARNRAHKINRNILEAAPPHMQRPYLLNPFTDLPNLLDAIDSFDPNGLI